MSKLIIGLTGGIGSGKTVVANYFGELGIDIIDADIIARDLVTPDKPYLKKLIDLFGVEILNKDNTLNRKSLRRIVFSDNNKLKKLNSILHPIIKTEMKKQASISTSPYVILVIPLLFESDFKSVVNKVLVVDVNIDLQIKRAMERDKETKEQIIAIIDNQVTREARLEQADFVIENNSDLEHVKAQVFDIHNIFKDCL